MNEPVKIHQTIAVIVACLLISFAIINHLPLTYEPLIKPQDQLAQVSSTATLSLSPSSRSADINTTFTVNIVVNTGGQQIYGVDVNRLRFNPSILQVVDASTATAGIQIAPGSLMTLIGINSVDNIAGTIQFSQVANPQAEGKYSGTGTLATITFKVVGAGISPVTIDFAANNSIDSNIAGLTGTDILASVSGGSYTGTTPVVIPTIDTSAPAITNISLSNITTTGATIRWTTNELSDTKVEYGLTTAYESNSPDNATPVTSHSVVLSNLLPGTSYHYRVKSRDAAGNLATSIDNILTTQGGLDKTKPAVPSEVKATPTGATQIQVSWTASIDPAGTGESSSGIKDYQVFRNGAFIATTTSTGYLDTGLAPSTSYSYQVTANDNVGNISLKSVSANATTPAVSKAVQRKIILVLEGVPGTKRNVDGIVEFINPLNNSKVFQANIATDSSGQYVLSVPAGLVSTTNLRVIIPGYLSRLSNNIDLLNEGIIDVTFPTLPAGDFNSDKEINTLDFSYMNSRWGMSDQLADINRDGAINSLDFSFLSNNWSLVGH